jgi:peptidoglycan/xylan/chitin deacetylase (PgdA/CDA1 family)
MKATTLMYHDVVPPGADDTSGFEGRDAALYKLDSAMFDDHLRELAKVLPSVASVANGGAARVEDALLGGSIRAEPFFLTFDDGGESAIHVADKLDAMGWAGHFFVTTDRIGTRGFVGADQIRELARRGHVVGSHSSSHPARMSSCTRTQLDYEWSNSLKVLSEIIGDRVRVASIPGGYGSREVAESAAAAGIRALFTSEPIDRIEDVAGCLVLGRYTIQRFTPAVVAADLASGRLRPRMRQRVLWNLKKAAKAVGGERYLRVRKRILG